MRRGVWPGVRLGVKDAFPVGFGGERGWFAAQEPDFEVTTGVLAVWMTVWDV
jgi:hypothetical protein